MNLKNGPVMATVNSRLLEKPLSVLSFNMKQTTRLHGFFHSMIMFHITGWKNPCALVNLVALSIPLSRLLKSLISVPSIRQPLTGYK
jgi:hypothetical protein